MAKYILVLIISLVQGCALTSPDGTREFLDDMKRDQVNQSTDQSAFVGKPKFVKVRAYPQVRGNHITGKHWILLKTGNENLNLEKMMLDLEEN